MLEVPVLPKALDVAIGEGHQLVIGVILCYHPDILKKHPLQRISNINFARWLMELRLHFNNASWLGNTLMHRAAGDWAERMGYEDIVLLLIPAGKTKD